MKKTMVLGFVFLFVLLAFIENVFAIDFYTIYNPFTGTLDYYALYNKNDEINISVLNITSELMLFDFNVCTLKTHSNGTVYCGTDNVGGSGIGLWQIVNGWMFGNETAGGSQKINVTDINTTRLNVSGTATIGEVDIAGDANISGNATIDGDIRADRFRKNETINSTFYIDDDGTFVFYAETI